MKAILYILSILLCLNLEGQELERLHSIQLKAQADFIEVDQFGSIYLVLDNELRKLNNKGEYQASYSDPLQGSISDVDLLNPMNPIVYFQNSNELRILDNRLNQSRELNLAYTFNDPSSIAAAAENSIWLYDQNADQMIRYSFVENRILNRSPIISQILNDDQAEVLSFKAGFDQLVVHIKQAEKESFLLFDAQGSFQKKLALSASLSSYSYFNQKLSVLLSNGLLRIYNLNFQNHWDLICPVESARQVFYFHPQLYLYDGDKLHQYRVQSPSKSPNKP
ncbi:hypothetical protein [Croceimicrobium sp.]|uniref:hypothetical protein n=1 Tax=Croceimicrobium sp. TaxID=2828340 RepID=UPI003BA92349